MRTVGAVVLLLTVAISACGRGTGAGLPDGWPAERTFRSTSVTEGGQDRPLVAGTRVELRLGRDGRLGAQAGCNQLGATARVEDGHLVIDGGLSQTEIGCDPDLMAQDEWLGTFLDARPAWRLDGDELVLTSGGVEIILVDREVLDPDRSLLDTRWVVDTIFTGDAASSVPRVPVGASPAKQPAGLVLDSTGRFNGHTGCAFITGTAVVRGEEVLFTIDGAPACTEPGVPTTAMPPGGTPERELHEAVIATLRGEVRFRIEGPRLTLTGPDGHGLGLAATAS